MTSSISGNNSKYSSPIVPKRIDNRMKLCPSLDYSFLDAQKLEEIISVEPRIVSSASNLIKEGEKYHSYGLILNHNRLTGSLEKFPNFVRIILINPNALSILDLSFNAFNQIPFSITQFPSLRYFYFHKNNVVDINEIDKLFPLQKLKYLTLHGNPIEVNVPYVRSYVLAILPNLRSLNCTPVSKGDLKNSETWQKMNKNLLPNFYTKDI